MQSTYSSGRFSSSVDASNNSTRFTYDTAGQHETVIDRLGNSTTYGYDQDGNVTSVTDASGQDQFFHLRRRRQQAD